jgi:hypothetical protein
MHIYRIGTTADVSLGAGVAKTILAWITGATRRAKLLEIQLGFNSQVSTDQAVLVEVVRFTIDGTGTAVTPVADDPGNPAAIGTAKHSYSVEPTTPTVILPGQRITPQQGGTMILQLPFGREILCGVSGLFGIRLTAPNAQTGVRATMQVEE